jgi:hypothetical protein
VFAKLIILLVVARNYYFGGSFFITASYLVSLILCLAKAKSLPVMSVVLTPSVLLKTLYLLFSLNISVTSTPSLSKQGSSP